mgnify:CR=1 FL=1
MSNVGLHELALVGWIRPWQWVSSAPTTGPPVGPPGSGLLWQPVPAPADELAPPAVLALYSEGGFDIDDEALKLFEGTASVVQKRRSVSAGTREPNSGTSRSR